VNQSLESVLYGNPCQGKTNKYNFLGTTFACSFWNQVPTQGTQATVFKTDVVLGKRVGLEKLKSQCSPTLFQWTYVLAYCSLGYQKPSTSFESSDNIDSDNFCEFFSVSLGPRGPYCTIFCPCYSFQTVDTSSSIISFNLEF